MEATNQNRERQSEAPSEMEVAEIRNALRGILFGSVQIVVQNGVIVQIDRTEKRRLHDGRRKHA
jgi:hypothetical protein